MDVLLLNSGKNALATALANSDTVIVNKVRIGVTPAITLNPNATDVVGFIYEGGPGNIFFNKVADDIVRFIIDLDTSVGDFVVGNIMLFLDDNTPFLSASIEGSGFPKYRENLPTQVGNKGSFHMSVKYANISTGIDFTIINPDYATIPSVVSDLTLPSAGSAPYDAYLIQNNTNTGTPTIAIRRAIDNKWFGAFLSDDLRSADFGIIDGGILQENPYTNTVIYGGGYYSPYPSQVNIRDFGTYTGSAPTTSLDFGTWS